MEPKQKAIELVDRFAESRASVFPDSVLHLKHGKKDALICVNETLKIYNQNKFQFNDKTQLDNQMRFWIKVREEIEKM